MIKENKMPTIIWEGNKKEFGTSHECPPLPENAVKLREADGFIAKALPYGIAPVMICILAVFLKAYLKKAVPIDPIFMIPAFIIGFVVALPLHELMHAICYPKGATVWVGLCLRKFAAYAISYCPLTKTRFTVMSLAPSLLGIIPLAVFIAAPVTMKPLLTMCIVPAIFGLFSPAPDYMDIVSMLRHAPKGALIRDSADGLYAYCTEDNG